MLPVLGPDALRDADLRTLEAQDITSVQLMERAAQACADVILELLRQGRFGPVDEVQFIVCAGMGNNGGDGLVIARRLHIAGYPVRVLRVMHTATTSADHATVLAQFRQDGGTVVDVVDGSGITAFGETEVVIDALLGTGNARALIGVLAACVAAINASGRPVIAIDLPTGLHADGGTDPDLAVHARWTLTIGAHKSALFLADCARYIGEWRFIPIGLEFDKVDTRAMNWSLTEEVDVTGGLGKRPTFGHKGTFGHAMLIAGQRGMMGAAVLATRAALRSGPGLVTAHVPGDGLNLLQTHAPEALCIADHSDIMITDGPHFNTCSAIAMGPGTGTADATKQVLKRLIQDATVPVLLDADALNMLAAEPTWIAFLPPGTILTPHPKEFDRLVGSTSRTSRERLERAREFALKNRCIVVLKGAWTAICPPDGHVHFNPTGNPGMTKGGMGDALTGLITGLLAQGFTPANAARTGVYLHGLAGDIAAASIGMDGMTAMDLVDAIPAAWQVLRKLQSLFRISSHASSGLFSAHASPGNFLVDTATRKFPGKP